MTRKNVHDGGGGQHSVEKRDKGGERNSPFQLVKLRILWNARLMPPNF